MEGQLRDPQPLRRASALGTDWPRGKYNKHGACSGHLTMAFFFSVKLTWHLSFANILKILNDPCVNVNHSIKCVVAKKET